MAAVTFATGAYAAWGSMFYQEVHHLSAADAGKWIGGLLVGAGVLGILLGRVLPDLLLRFTKRAYLLLAATAVMAATPLGVIGILDPEYRSSLGFLFAASVLLAMVLGPCNTVIANVVPANRRAAAFACFIFSIHLFGDISSPILLGWIAERFGNPAVAASPLGRFFASLGAHPVGNANWTLAMLSVAPVLALGCVFFLIGSRTLPEDQERAGSAAKPGGDLRDFHY
jgi:hypothetical protein